jgi:uncharacterized protein
MKLAFVDTAFWIARFDKTDALHIRATQVVESLGDGIRFVTTDAVLTEFMNYFSKAPPELRQRTAEFVKGVVLQPTIEVVFHGHGYFVRSVEFYGQRKDKGYSLTDCISMLVLQDWKIQDVLSHDKHFRQEGFNTLL